MTFDREMALVLAILVGTVVLFASERFRIDQVALMVLALLLALGLVTAEQAVAGFSNPATVTVAAMFVLSAGLRRTGALFGVLHGLLRLGGRPSLLLVVIMLSAGAASAFINNTPVVAVMLPIVFTVAVKKKISPSKWLIPLSYASQFGGVCTLMGTSTNLLVSASAEGAGLGPFGLFEFTKLGLVFFAAGILYFLLVGRFLLPDRPAEEPEKGYHRGPFIAEMHVVEESNVTGKKIRDLALTRSHDVQILGVLSRGRAVSRPRDRELAAGDVLLVRGEIKDLMRLRSAERLEMGLEMGESRKDVILVEALVASNSRLAGNTLSDFDARRHLGAAVLGIQRRGQRVRNTLDRIRLRVGDALLLESDRENLDRLQRTEDIIVLEEHTEMPFRRGRAPLAVGIVSAVVLGAALTPLPIVATAVVGAVAMVGTGCLRLEGAYDAIDWQVVFLLAGLLPLGAAMTNSGLARWITEVSLGVVGGFGPVAVLAMFYLLAAVLTEAMSNNAAAVLLSPIAISIASGMGVSAAPFLMAVTFAASTAFATPIGYQTNAMIYNPGGYRFTDYLKVGIPLNLIFWLLAWVLIPRIWPF